MIVEQRADGKVETEATIKIWVDGERYVRTAEGNGPVNALDAALRAAIGEIHPHLQGHRARQLQGPHPRRGRRAPARSRACSSTPPTAATSGARSASPRTSSPPPGRRSSTRSSTPSSRAARRRTRRARRRRRDAGVSDADHRGRSRSPSPSSAPRRRRAVIEVLRSGQLSLGPRVPGVRGRPSRRGSAPRTPARSRAAPPACTSRCARSAWRTATRSSRRRSRSSPAPTSVALRARAAGLRRHRPGHAEPRSRPPRRRRSPSARRALLPVHIFGYPADLPAFERLGLPIVEDACEALGARARRRRARSARAATRRSSASTPTSS